MPIKINTLYTSLSLPTYYYVAPLSLRVSNLFDIQLIRVLTRMLMRHACIALNSERSYANFKRLLALTPRQGVGWDTQRQTDVQTVGQADSWTARHPQALAISCTRATAPTLRVEFQCILLGSTSQSEQQQ